jgi:hypothetical protein
MGDVEPQTVSDAPARLPATDKREQIAIVGGGIAGLFCAYVLANDGHEVELYESSDVLGGRIRSFRFYPELLDGLDTTPDDERHPIKDIATLGPALKPSWPTGYSTKEYNKREWDRLEFNAEFGPMRVELDVQRMLGFVLRWLDIPAPNAKAPEVKPATAHAMVRQQRFPAFSSPASTSDPVYDLKPEELGKNPLELLQLGVCRAVVDLNFEERGQDSPLSDNDPRVRQRHKWFLETRDELVADLAKAAATQRPGGPVFESWLRQDLHEDDYWIIQRYGRVPVLYGSDHYIPLHTMGFWNLMAAYLSHNALSKVRDLGSFYHFIPENPNAAEWLTWWMRQFSISSDLVGVFGGMQAITEKLAIQAGLKIEDLGAELQELQTKDPGAELPPKDPSAELLAEGCSNGGSLKIFRKHTVQALLRDPRSGNRIQFQFRDFTVSTQCFQRVVLALPAVPAEKLIQASSGVFPNVQAQQDFAELLHTSLPLQLVKVFFIVRERWWEEDVRANLGATRYPTREVYFWKSRIKGSRRGLIMLYTDRPAASFWANYVPGRIQDDIDELCRPKGKESKAIGTLRARMKSRFIEYVLENEGVRLNADDIIWCGIMDWGREPYGAASHAWRPNSEYWTTLSKLADWPLNDGAHLHVCGEAYSDYHGFIEGALRSAVHVLTQIKASTKQTNLQRLESIIKVLLDTKGDQVNFKDIDKCIENEVEFAKGKEPKDLIAPGKNVDDVVTDKTLGKDEKYLKDFLDWSGKLNPEITT